jgi:hypothetical protein
MSDADRDELLSPPGAARGEQTCVNMSEREIRPTLDMESVVGVCGQTAHGVGSGSPAGLLAGFPRIAVMNAPVTA